MYEYVVTVLDLDSADAVAARIEGNVSLILATSLPRALQWPAVIKLLEMLSYQDRVDAVRLPVGAMTGARLHGVYQA